MSDSDPPRDPPPGGVELPARNVVLIGYRGCGKTSVGRRLAARLGWPLVDTDERVEAAAGHSIQDIFATQGEPAFRQLETAIIAQVTRGTHQIISVGGGAVLSEANRATLRAAGPCIWLTAPVEALHQRILADPGTGATRPALTDRPGLDEVRHLLAQRQPLYAALADHVVDTVARSVEQVADAVLTAVAEGDTSSETP